MNIDPIPDIKQLPDLYGAHKEGKLLIFIGAGLSALWGCPRWKDVAIALLGDCHKYGDIDYWTREILAVKYSSSPRKLITIAKSMLGDKYLYSLQNALKVSEERRSKFPKLFENLGALNATFLTTNIDGYFSGLFRQENIHSDPGRFSVSNLKPGHLFHLHGVVHAPTTLVLTIDEYILRYQHDGMRGFLEHTFFEDTYRLLFIGYGVDEMEIIDYMIEKYSKGPKTLTRFINRFYILLPFFRTEESLLEHELSYFRQINMNVIPYAIDSIGYDQLYFIIEKWKEELSRRDGKDLFYGFTEIIDRTT